jgi:hypothetical protein
LEWHEQERGESRAMRFAAKTTMTVNNEFQVVIDAVLNFAAEATTLMH